MKILKLISLILGIVIQNVVYAQIEAYKLGKLEAFNWGSVSATDMQDMSDLSTGVSFDDDRDYNAVRDYLSTLVNQNSTPSEGAQVTQRAQESARPVNTLHLNNRNNVTYHQNPDAMALRQQYINELNEYRKRNDERILQTAYERITPVTNRARDNVYYNTGEGRKRLQGFSANSVLYSQGKKGQTVVPSTGISQNNTPAPQRSVIGKFTTPKQLTQNIISSDQDIKMIIPYDGPPRIIIPQPNIELPESKKDLHLVVKEMINEYEEDLQSDKESFLKEKNKLESVIEFLDEQQKEKEKEMDKLEYKKLGHVINRLIGCFHKYLFYSKTFRYTFQ